MAMHEIEPLPVAVRRRLAKKGSNTHPGLHLDKYVQSWSEQFSAGDWSKRVQQPAIEEIVSLSRTPMSGMDFEWLMQRHRSIILGLGQGREVNATTTGPMTLHLSRASSLENAGICLHPIYGFVYLPGSGIKGMSRAWAETVWLPIQENREQAWEQLEDVFGWSPNKLRNKQIKDKSHPARHRTSSERVLDQSAGGIIFHDAWPQAWPKLQQDILNSHHQKYYRGKDNSDPPGDWEDPVPVYFLSVEPKTPFSLSLTTRTGLKSEKNKHLLNLAEQFLTGALLHNGVGAKTAAGYGAFQIDSSTQTESVESVWAEARSVGRFAAFDRTIRLSSPGFLAGGVQNTVRSPFSGAVSNAPPTVFRGATLRGQLRYWWRAMHAGFVDVQTVRWLEQLVWGSTDASSAVTVRIIPLEDHVPQEFAFKDEKGFAPRKRFAQAHGLRDAPFKVSQGLFYLAYGMDEKERGGGRRTRFFLDAGAEWRLEVNCSSVNLPSGADGDATRIVPASTIATEVMSALKMLCAFGSVGSKSRNGFGSIEITGEREPPPVSLIAQCADSSQKFRELILGESLPFTPQLVDSPAIGSNDWYQFFEFDLKTADPWQASDRVGFAVQAFMTDKRHDPSKRSFGLPRKIHGPRPDGPITAKSGKVIQDASRWQPPQWLEHDGSTSRDASKIRYASPVHLSIHRTRQGTLSVRVLALPAARIPESRGSHGEFLKVFATALEKEVSASRPASPMPQGSAGKRPSGAAARVTIVAKRPVKKGKDGGYDVKEEGRPQGVLTVGIPPEVVGANADVLVHIDDPKRPQYRWPNITKERKSASQKKGKRKKRKP